MKTTLFLKLLVIVPAVFLVDYIIMAVIGCTTCLFGLGENFICSSYCIAGKIILALSLVLIIYLILPDLKAITKIQKDGTTT